MRKVEAAGGEGRRAVAQYEGGAFVYGARLRLLQEWRKRGNGRRGVKVIDLDGN